MVLNYMKKSIETYLTDSFEDFEGKKHYVTLCALSQPAPDDMIVTFKQSANIDIVMRTLSLGVAICNPDDQFSEESGKHIALNNAKSEKSITLYVNHSGVINTRSVAAILAQEMEYIKQNPGKYIKGYNEAKKKYLHKKEYNDLYDTLDDAEQNVVMMIANGEFDYDLFKEIAKSL
jgi:hypothetical protein